jgi:hypothetical protein
MRKLELEKDLPEVFLTMESTILQMFIYRHATYNSSTRKIVKICICIMQSETSSTMASSPSFRNNNYTPIICTFYDPKKHLGIYISIFLEIWLTSSAFMYIIES